VAAWPRSHAQWPNAGLITCLSHLSYASPMRHVPHTFVPVTQLSQPWHHGWARMSTYTKQQRMSEVSHYCLVCCGPYAVSCSAAAVCAEIPACLPWLQFYPILFGGLISVLVIPRNLAWQRLPCLVAPCHSSLF
jgi:hypothetical protein